MPVKKILLVDDSGVALMMEKMILQREAYDLQELTSRCYNSSTGNKRRDCREGTSPCW